jgi:hypothetical protein
MLALVFMQIYEAQHWGDLPIRVKKKEQIIDAHRQHALLCKADSPWKPK